MWLTISTLTSGLTSISTIDEDTYQNGRNAIVSHPSFSIKECYKSNYGLVISALLTLFWEPLKISQKKAVDVHIPGWTLAGHGRPRSTGGLEAWVGSIISKCPMDMIVHSWILEQPILGEMLQSWPISPYVRLSFQLHWEDLRSTTSTTVMRLATITSPLSRLWRWAEAPSEFDGCWSSCTASFAPMQGDVNWPEHQQV